MARRLRENQSFIAVAGPAYVDARTDGEEEEEEEDASHASKRRAQSVPPVALQQTGSKRPRKHRKNNDHDLSSKRDHSKWYGDLEHNAHPNREMRDFMQEQSSGACSSAVRTGDMYANANANTQRSNNVTTSESSSTGDTLQDIIFKATEHRRNCSNASAPSMLGCYEEFLQETEHAYNQDDDESRADVDPDGEDNTLMRHVAHEIENMHFDYMLPDQTQVENCFPSHERRPALHGLKDAFLQNQKPNLGPIQILSLSEPGILRKIARFLPVPETVHLTLVCPAFLHALQNFPLRLDRLSHVFDLHELADSVVGIPLANSHSHTFMDADYEYAHPDDEEMTPVCEEGNEECAQMESTERISLGKRLVHWDISGVRIRFTSEQDKQQVWDVLGANNLRRLILTGDVQCIDATDMIHHKQLECFDAGVSCHQLENSHVLQSLSKLSHVYLRSTQNLLSVDFLPTSNRLEELSLYMCKNLQNIDALSACANLTVLDLGGCHQLRDITALIDCTSLEKLSIADCARVTDIASLACHERLFHLDISGCFRVQDLQPLKTLHALLKLKLKRCDVYATETLLSSENLTIALEAKANLLTYRIGEVDEILPQLLDRLRSLFVETLSVEAVYQRRVVEDVLIVLSAFAFREGLRSSTALAQSGAIAVLLRIAGETCTSASARRLAYEVIARISQTRESVSEVARHGTGHVVVNELCRTLSLYHSRDPTQLDIVQYCASTILFLAAVEGQRERLVQETPQVIPCLVRLVEIGTPETVAEAAGALWNLAASLDIGSIIAITPGAVVALAGVLKTGTITAKLQASGALRNLAILDSNKDILSTSDVLDPLVSILKVRALANAALIRNPSLVRTMVEFNEDETMLVVKAAATIRILSTKESVQSGLTSLGAVASLVSLLTDRDAVLRRQVCGALLALSFHDGIRSLMVAAGAIDHLVRIIDASHNDSMIISAVGCLWNLAMHDGGERIISGNHLAIPALIRCLDSDNVEIVCRVAGTLRTLACQETQKKVIVLHGGVIKLVKHIKLPCSKSLIQVIAALRLVASGPDEVRTAIVQAGAIAQLAQVLANGSNEAIYLALSTLTHLAPMHAKEIVDCIPISRLLELYTEASRHSTEETIAHNSLVQKSSEFPLAAPMSTSPALVREDVGYILQRIAMLGVAPKVARDISLRDENETILQQIQAGCLQMRRIRGVPGDLRLNVFGRGTLHFHSYATAAAVGRFATQGKVFYEIEIVKSSDSPSFGWISSRFAMYKNYLSDFGVGYPTCIQDSWAIDGVNCRTWPGKSPFGLKWKDGDILTVGADLESGKIIFGLNGDFSSPMGVAFTGLRESSLGFCEGIAPAISASQGTILHVNFGQQPMRYSPPGFGFQPFATLL